MKIRKRHQPLDLESLGYDDQEPARAPAAEPERPSEPMLEPAADAPLAREPGEARVTAAAPRVPAPRPALEAPTADPLPPAWPVYLAALVVSVLWALAPIAFAWGYRRSIAPFDFDPFAITVFAMLALGPALLVWLGAYMIRQGQKLGAEAQRAKRMADDLAAPALAAGLQTVDVAHGVREEIGLAAAAAQEARETLLALRQALAVETEQLVEAASSSARTAKGLAETLGRERSEMAGLSGVLDGQATAVADAITRQARMVAEASDLAQTQLREAEAALAARAADLAAAAGETTDAARTAADDLTRHIARLETAGLGVREQISAVEKDLTEQRAGLVTVSHALRADQEAFAAQAESHAAKLAEFIAQARLSAAEMGDRAVKGGEALRQLIAQAAEQFRELADSARAERDEFGQSTLHALEAVSDAAGQERARLEEQTRAAITALASAAEETRAAAAKHAEAARDQVDQLSEAAFTAGQHANKVFEARLAEARALIEQSAHMVEEAGAATARKLEEGARSARTTLDELNRILADVDARAAQLPQRARGEAEQVRRAVTESLEDLMEQARRTAEETQAIDEAFQERVRRNYEVLSDAVRLMGSVATLAPPPAPRERPARVAAPEPERRPLRRAEAPAPAPEPMEEAELELELGLDQAVSPPTDEERSSRPRLRLTPTATDEEFSQVFEQASGRPPAEAAEPTEAAEGWSWKDLLSSLDEVDEDDAEAELADLLTHEITAMGIDPLALLPKSRVEELAATVQTGDLGGAREVVRRLAPAATRRLTRRIMSDKALERQVVKYLIQYGELLEDAVERDPAGFTVGSLLGSDAGRTYLLLNAAAGDRI
ncbi:MAG: polar localization protein TipN [Phenylobacterium sp.]|uniref:polar localization protein TipN n=1 Tax=Phenylobacterium sp. TaxID=1871053 RepID=UPI00391DE287